MFGETMSFEERFQLAGRIADFVGAAAHL